MKIEAIGAQELKDLYETRMREDFPPSELRPYSNMIYLLERGEYRCFVAREAGEILAYAFFAVKDGAVLLDYLAVDSSCRGQGVGSRFLSGLKDVSKQFGGSHILIEAESVESAVTPEQTEERERRLRFYRRCGCRATGVYSLLFGVEYQILCLPLSDGGAPGQEEVNSGLESLYRMIVPPIVGGDESAFHKVCRCFFRPETGEQPRDFARELGRSITCLYRNRSKFLGERLREYGFAGAMYMMLLHVDRHPGATQDSIATHMYIDKSNVARRIKQLEELGYVRRETDLSDRRQNNLYLTDRGRELAPLIRSYLSQWGESISAGLTEAERDTLLSLLAKMTACSRNSKCK